MKIKTSELVGPSLDWAVAKALGYDCQFDDEVSGPWLVPQNGYLHDEMPLANFSPSTRNHTVIDIMEREGINSRALRRDGHPMNGLWLAAYDHGNTGSMVQWVRREDWPRHYLSGPTLRIAVCRAFVASKLGDEVEVPDELLEK